MRILPKYVIIELQHIQLLPRNLFLQIIFLFFFQRHCTTGAAESGKPKGAAVAAGAHQGVQEGGGQGSDGCRCHTSVVLPSPPPHTHTVWPAETQQHYLVSAMQLELLLRRDIRPVRPFCMTAVLQRRPEVGRRQPEVCRRLPETCRRRRMWTAPAPWWCLRRGWPLRPCPVSPPISRCSPQGPGLCSCVSLWRPWTWSKSGKYRSCLLGQIREMENISRGPIFGDFVNIRTEGSMQDVMVARPRSTRVQTPLSHLF